MNKVGGGETGLGGGVRRVKRGREVQGQNMTLKKKRGHTQTADIFIPLPPLGAYTNHVGRIFGNFDPPHLCTWFAHAPLVENTYA